MPKVHEEAGFRISFFSNERNEPIHVHITKGDAHAKYWMSPIRHHISKGYSPGELKRIEIILVEQKEKIERQWNEFAKRRNL
jgi:hypothetical protein